MFRHDDTKMMFVKRIQGLIRESIRQINVRKSVNMNVTTNDVTKNRISAYEEKNDKKSDYINRYSCQSDGPSPNISHLNSNNNNNNNHNPPTRTVPDSPVWKPRMIMTQSSYNESSSSTSSSSQQKAKDVNDQRTKRHIQFKLPKNSFNELGSANSKVDSSYVVVTNMESTDC